MQEPEYVITDYDAKTGQASVEFVGLPGVPRPLGVDGGLPIFGRLLVGFEPSDPQRALWVQLELSEGLTPTALQRFPWAKWLTVADAEARRQGRKAVSNAAWKALGATERPKRPGRKGHEPGFLEGVAAEYLELRASGVIAPAKIIARRRHHTESTVRGWIRQCRKSDPPLLPPARPGRAG